MLTLGRRVGSLSRRPMCLLSSWVEETVSSASMEDGLVRVVFSSGRDASFDAVWLRDHCPSTKSRDPVTLQRLHATLSIPQDLEPSFVRVSGVSLEVGWPSSTIDPEGHVSHYSGAYLASHAYRDLSKEDWLEKRYDADPIRAFPMESWSGNGWESRGELDYVDVMESDEGRRRVLERLIDPGVVFVHGCPVSEEATQDVAERVGHLSRTLYGDGMWRTEVRDEVNDTAYLTIGLPPHTDGTYLDPAPGVQVFHCLRQSEVGGETLLVDGLKIVERLRRDHPETFSFFSTTLLPFAHRDQDTSRIEWKRVIDLYEDDGSFRSISVNNDDRTSIAALSLGASNASSYPTLHHHIRTLSSIVLDPAMPATLPLKPGTVCLINNHRVLHGRTAFEPNSKRVLAGCYIDRDVWQGNLRALYAKKLLEQHPTLQRGDLPF